ncbi:MAG: hypothetical protein EOP10_09475 [Proteobacteria bacterium]|nr:MAG: hypothetical protein EOP10_09475 [Pseudomonadota bacterium]
MEKKHWSTLIPEADGDPLAALEMLKLVELHDRCEWTAQHQIERMLRRHMAETQKDLILELYELYYYRPHGAGFQMQFGSARFANSEMDAFQKFSSPLMYFGGQAINWLLLAQAGPEDGMITGSIEITLRTTRRSWMEELASKHEHGFYQIRRVENMYSAFAESLINDLMESEGDHA